MSCEVSRLEDASSAHCETSRTNMAQKTDEGILNGWETLVYALVGVHLVALAFWMYRVATEKAEPRIKQT